MGSEMFQEQMMDIFFLHPAILFLVMFAYLSFKGVVLWRAARNDDLAWFAVILLLNTFVLEIILGIIYLLLKPERKQKETEKSQAMEDKDQN